MSENTALLLEPEAKPETKSAKPAAKKSGIGFVAKLNFVSEMINTITSVLSGKSTLPVLQHIHVTTSNNMASLYVNNLEVGIRAELPTKVTKDGVTTIPGKKVSEFLKSFSGAEDQDVTFETNGNKTRVVTARSRVDYASLNEEDYPKLENVDMPYSMPAAKFSAALIQTLPAASTDETRHVLGGVYIEQVGGSLQMVATDGRRLHVATPNIVLDKAAASFKPLILPLAAVQAILKILDSGVEDANAMVSIGSDSKSFALRFGKYVLVSRVIEGSYPDYRKVIPPSDRTPVIKIDVPRKSLSASVKRTRLADRKSGLTLLLKENHLHLLASQKGEIESEDVLDVVFSGEEYRIGLNSDFLLDTLDAAPGESVTIAMSDPNSPIVISDGKSTDFMAIIMPIRIS